MAGRKIDRTGHRYGRLTVVREAGRNRHGHVTWICTCECEKQVTVVGGDLKSGNTAGCGCITGGRTHGLSLSQEYICWKGMKQRCYNTKYVSYDCYGGRGIIVCKRWRDSYKAFIADMGPRPSTNHSIDRIDNDGDYGPENCRWATRVEQSNNCRRNRWLTVGGVRKTQTQWSRDLGGCDTLVSTRIRLGWSLADAVSLPTGSKNPQA